MSTPEVEALARLAGLGVPVDSVKALNAPTPREEIKQRPGPHSKRCEKPYDHEHPPLDYIDARYVMDVLDEKVGPENWSRDHRMTESGKVACGIGINVDGNWIWKWDGAGETDIEGEKGSFSDSFKRAAVSWGIARDLYDKDRPAAPVAAPRPQAARPPAASYANDYPEDYGDVDDDLGDGDGRCPDHELPWTLKPGGFSKTKKDEHGNPKPYDAFYTCPFKPQRGQPFCNNKPSKAWLAGHEV